MLSFPRAWVRRATAGERGWEEDGKRTRRGQEGEEEGGGGQVLEEVGKEEKEEHGECPPGLRCVCSKAARNQAWLSLRTGLLVKKSEQTLLVRTFEEHLM